MLRLLFTIIAITCLSLTPWSDPTKEWQRHAIDDSSTGADGTRLADVNNDGLPDITTGWEEGGKIRVYLHPGTNKVKAPWPTVTVGQVKSPEDAVFADLDGDGSMDVVSSCEGNERSVFVHWAPKEKEDYLNPEAWETEAFPTLEKKQQWMFCLPMQIDEQHGIDLVLSAKGENAQIGWLQSPENPRDLSAWKWHPMYEAGWIMSLRAVDMDQDGDLDVLTTDRKGNQRGCHWLENPGLEKKQTQPWPLHRIGGDDQEVMFLDINQKGDQLLIAIQGHELLWLQRHPFFNDIWNTTMIPLPKTTGTGKGVKLIDVDCDGHKDIVFSCEHAKDKIGVGWIKPDMTKPASEWPLYSISGIEGTKYDLLKAIDLDQDGDLDLLTCEEREDLGVIWYENPTY